MVEIAGCWWLKPVILAIQEAEIRGSQFKASPGQTIHETLSRKHPHKKGWWNGSHDRVSPEFKP
jgi:hypothetical protein